MAVTSRHRNGTILELQQLRLQWKRLVEAREENILFMHDIMSAAGYQPLSMIAGAIFDAASAHVKSVDAYLPVLQTRIDELAQQALAHFDPVKKRPRKERSAKPAEIHREDPKPAHVRWREWSVVDPELKYPVLIISGASDKYSDHVLADDIDRRAKATMAWAPWARRARRRSRRYEGFWR